MSKRKKFKAKTLSKRLDELEEVVKGMGVLLAGDTGVFPEELGPKFTELENRVCSALSVAAQYGGDPDPRHKMWVLDQMVRELTGCRWVTESLTDDRGNVERKRMDESADYHDFLEKAGHRSGWSRGTPP